MLSTRSVACPEPLQATRSASRLSSRPETTVGQSAQRLPAATDGLHYLTFGFLHMAPTPEEGLAVIAVCQVPAARQLV